jgi:hypothetical protein
MPKQRDARDALTLSRGLRGEVAEYLFQRDAPQGEATCRWVMQIVAVVIASKTELLLRAR